jgi:cell division protein FtsB
VSAVPARVADHPARVYTQPRAVSVRRRRKARRGVGRGVIWIILLAALLAGVVAVNLAVLRQNMQIENLAKKRVELIGRNQDLRSRLSQATSSSNIDRLARTKLGLVQAAPDQTTYIRLGTGGK